jgi:hypothetical protein
MTPQQPRKRGRPAGSIRILTAEERSLLLSAIENGASDHAAARMIEMDSRTFRRHRRIAEGRDSDLCSDSSRPFIKRIPRSAAAHSKKAVMRAIIVQRPDRRGCHRPCRCPRGDLCPSSVVNR